MFIVHNLPLNNSASKGVSGDVDGRSESVQNGVDGQNEGDSVRRQSDGSHDDDESYQPGLGDTRSANTRHRRRYTIN